MTWNQIMVSEGMICLEAEQPPLNKDTGMQESSQIKQRTQQLQVILQEKQQRTALQAAKMTAIMCSRDVKRKPRQKGGEFPKESPLPKPSSESKGKGPTWVLSRRPSIRSHNLESGH